ncbi:MAG: hypothetical protein RIQ60_2703 [Pseudomonadota bacterium]|jgi:hypothetical protein
MPPPRNAESNRWYRSGLFADSRPQQRADEDTQFATQFQRSPSDYLGSAPDIGRVVSHGVRELFISCEIGDALQQQFEHLRPTCITLHDLGCSVSRRLLAAIAAASNQPVERLVIRRAGFGTVIASLEFLDCATTFGAPIRLYSTDADADTQSRLSISRVLLGHSTMGAVLLGDLPAHALNELLEPLRSALSHGPWDCQQMLFMPLGPGPAAGNSVHERLQNSVVPVQVSPRVTMPAEAWSHLHASWNQLQRTLNPGSGGLQLAPLSEAAQPPVANNDRATVRAVAHPSAPAANSAAGVPLATANAPAGSVVTARRPGADALQHANAAPSVARPTPAAPKQLTHQAMVQAQPAATAAQGPAHAVSARALTQAAPVAAAIPTAVPTVNPLAAYVRGLAGIQGVVSACVFDIQSSRVLAHLGNRTSAADLARRGTTLLAASGQARKQLQLAGPPEEVLVRGGAQSLVLRVLASQPEWAVHIVYSPTQADWAPLRNQLIALDAALQRGPVL